MGQFWARTSTDVPSEGWDPGSVGFKAAGLSLLPEAWVPSWAVVRGGLAVSDADGWGSALAACETLVAKAGRWLLLRSNGPFEAHRPAAGRTWVLDAKDFATVAEALGEAVSDEQWPLVQHAVDPALLGIMSNERRISPNLQRWVVEGPIRLRGPRLTELGAEESSPGSGQPLFASDVDALELQLRQVASYLTALMSGAEIRCEWAWDGERLWILQADRQSAAGVSARGDRWLERPGRAIGHPVTNLSGLPAGWSKADALRRFSAHGWPTVATTTVDGGQWRLGQAEEIVAASGLVPEADAAVAIRTDTMCEQHRLLLPTSGPIGDLLEMSEFMENAAEQLAAAGVRDNEWMFLISTWVDARAGAWAHARPGSAEVTIDAAWGHPDGLHALPHDSYKVDLITSHVVETIRCKPMLLEGGGPGDWRYEPLGKRWDWTSTLTADQALRISSWCEQLACEIGEELQLLVLCGVDGGRDAAALLPLFFVAGDRLAESRGLDRHEAVAIASAADVERAAATAAAVTLRLPPDRLRNVEELRRIAAACIDAGVAVIVEGSQLGHAFYVLRMAGAEVVTTSAVEVDPNDWVTCVVASDDSISRIVALHRDDAIAWVERQCAVAKEAGDAETILLAQTAREQVDAILSGRVTPARFEELPLVVENLGPLDGYERDVRGQALAHLER